MDVSDLKYLIVLKQIDSILLKVYLCLRRIWDTTGSNSAFIFFEETRRWGCFGCIIKKIEPIWHWFL